MASVSKTKSGKYRFKVTINYQTHTKTFDTKAEGYLWEDDLKSGKVGKTQMTMTLADLLEKYRDEETPLKKGSRWETIRINKMLRDKKLVDTKLSDLSTNDFGEWRNRRLLEVKPLSVLREIAVLNPCLNHAVKEWKLLKTNPLADMRKPKKPPPRDRLLTADEIDKLCFALNYKPEGKLNGIMGRVGAAMLFAIETAFRQQEIANLKWADLNGRVARVKDSKTVAGIRDVPLSKRAMGIIDQCKGEDETLVFNLKTSQIDSLFRKAKKLTNIEGLHFHDTRANAITNFANKFEVYELAKIIGHKDLNQLMIYYRKKTSDLVHKLD